MFFSTEKPEDAFSPIFCSPFVADEAIATLSFGHVL